MNKRRKRRATQSIRRVHTEIITIRRSQLVGAAIIASSAMMAFAVTVPNVFSAGSTVSSADMNANFQALAAAVTVLENKLANVSIRTVNGHRTVRFTGVNVQLVNGAGSTATANGTGNLVIGYDEDDSSGSSRCSIGMNGSTQVTANTCVANGGTLSTTGFKTGSHYLVVGAEHSYSRYGGIVAGFQNVSNFDFASVSGGSGNTASGQYASVAGGVGNRATGTGSSASGGANGAAFGNYATISGGLNNTANGNYSSATGGYSNHAIGVYASVGGGYRNEASGEAASVIGGDWNRAGGRYANVSGGFLNDAPGDYSHIAGGSRGFAGGAYSGVGGGYQCNVSAASQWGVGRLTGGCGILNN